MPRHRSGHTTTRNHTPDPNTWSPVLGHQATWSRHARQVANDTSSHPVRRLPFTQSRPIALPSNLLMWPPGHLSNHSSNAGEPCFLGKDPVEIRVSAKICGKNQQGSTHSGDFSSATACHELHEEFLVVDACERAVGSSSLCDQSSRSLKLVQPTRVTSIAKSMVTRNQSDAEPRMPGQSTHRNCDVRWHSTMA